MMTCAVCGTVNEANARFCSRCGSALAAQGPATGVTVDLNRTSGSAKTYDQPQDGTVKVYDQPSSFPAPSATAATSTQPSFPPPSYAPSSGQAQSYQMPSTTLAPATNNLAVVSLVMSILSFVVLPVIGSIVGLVLGYQARREIRQSQGQQSGEGLATAGIIIGWVGIGLTVLVILGFCLIVVIGVSGASFS